jgi:hypothetical protein
MVLLIDRNVIASPVEDTGPVVSIASLVAGYEAMGHDRRTSLKKAAKELGISRDEAYRRMTAVRTLEKA